MIKQRIAALETIIKKVNAPNRAEYNEAVYQAFKHYLDRMETDSAFIPAQEETAGKELIKAYESIHGEQKNIGLIDRFFLEIDQETEC